MLYGVDLSCTVFYDIEAKSKGDAHKKAVALAGAALLAGATKLLRPCEYGGVAFEDAAVCKVLDKTGWHTSTVPIDQIDVLRRRIKTLEEENKILLDSAKPIVNVLEERAAWWERKHDNLCRDIQRLLLNAWRNDDGEGECNEGNGRG